MNRQMRVPIRVRRPTDGLLREIKPSRQAVVEAEPFVVEERPVSRPAEDTVSAEPLTSKPTASENERRADLEEELKEWRNRALRLQAEMENFRKRQQRLAEERETAARERLLRGFLTISDDLERALNAGHRDENAALHEGVEMTYRSLKQLLRQEGVEEMKVDGEPFDPTLHEAVATVPHVDAGVDQDTIVEVSQRGYRLDGRLLRPARVVVAN